MVHVRRSQKIFVRRTLDQETASQQPLHKRDKALRSAERHVLVPERVVEDNSKRLIRALVSSQRCLKAEFCVHGARRSSRSLLIIVK
eukprot:359205-Chlamydomonas_euryale.AAC.2